MPICCDLSSAVQSLPLMMLLHNTFDNCDSGHTCLKFTLRGSAFDWSRAQLVASCQAVPVGLLLSNIAAQCYCLCSWVSVMSCTRTILSCSDYCSLPSLTNLHTLLQYVVPVVPSMQYGQLPMSSSFACKSQNSEHQGSAAVCPSINPSLFRQWECLQLNELTCFYAAVCRFLTSANRKSCMLYCCHCCCNCCDDAGLMTTDPGFAAVAVIQRLPT